jgi:hypothetical protein
MSVLRRPDNRAERPQPDVKEQSDLKNPDGPAADAALLDHYRSMIRRLGFALHELPTGVLADETGCAELARMLSEVEELASLFGFDHDLFIDGCRWHLEHWPHYLGRARHFKSYQEYCERQRGPLHVNEPAV